MENKQYYINRIEHEIFVLLADIDLLTKHLKTPQFYSKYQLQVFRNSKMYKNRLLKRKRESLKQLNK